MSTINREEQRVFERSMSMPKNIRYISPQQGRDFNEVSLEVGQIFYAWLRMSGLTEQLFLELVRDSRFWIDYRKQSTEIKTLFFIDNTQVGVPLVCDDMSHINDYNTDLYLFIMCFASKINDALIQDKMKKMINKIRNNN